MGSVAITMSPGSYQHFTIFVVELMEGNKAMYKPCSKFEGRFQVRIQNRSGGGKKLKRLISKTLRIDLVSIDELGVREGGSHLYERLFLILKGEREGRGRTSQKIKNTF